MSKDSYTDVLRIVGCVVLVVSALLQLMLPTFLGGALGIATTVGAAVVVGAYPTVKRRIAELLEESQV